MTDSAANSAKPDVLIWDIWIRLFHWTLATAIIFLLVSGETGWQFFEWHRLVGEGVLALVLFRVCWGLVGSSNASLIRLIASPRRAFLHLRHLVSGKVEPERGHNAAGGYAVLLMLLLIGFQATSGLFIADEDELIEGVFYGVLSSSASDQLYTLHHWNAGLIKAVVILHVLMVLIYLLRAGQNLVKPMFSGRIQWPQDTALPELRRGESVLGLVLFGCTVLLAGWLFSWWW